MVSGSIVNHFTQTMYRDHIETEGRIGLPSESYGTGITLRTTESSLVGYLRFAVAGIVDCWPVSELLRTFWVEPIQLPPLKSKLLWISVSTDKLSMSFWDSETVKFPGVGPAPSSSEMIPVRMAWVNAERRLNRLPEVGGFFLWIRRGNWSRLSWCVEAAASPNVNETDFFASFRSDSWLKSRKFT